MTRTLAPLHSTETVYAKNVVVGDRVVNLGIVTGTQDAGSFRKIIVNGLTWNVESGRAEMAEFVLVHHMMDEIVLRGK